MNKNCSNEQQLEDIKNIVNRVVVQIEQLRVDIYNKEKNKIKADKNVLNVMADSMQEAAELIQMHDDREDWAILYDNMRKGIYSLEIDAMILLWEKKIMQCLSYSDERRTNDTLLQVIDALIKEVEFLKNRVDALYSNYNVVKGWHLDINKEKINYQLGMEKELGITKQKRDTEIIVSLTSYPARMYDVHYALYSLLHQTLKPDRVILFLAKDEFPNMEEDLADNVLSLKEQGLSIMWCENIRSYKKLIPALREFPDDIIVTADDDIFYPENWLELLYNSYLEKPKCVHCHRAHQVQIVEDGIAAYNSWEKEIKTEKESYTNFPTGCGGVLYPPHVFYHDVTRKDYFMELSRTADDIWFWAMEVLNHTKIVVVKDGIRKLRYTNYAREIGLSGETTLGMKNLGNDRMNDICLSNVLSKYPELLQIIESEMPECNY